MQTLRECGYGSTEINLLLTFGALENRIVFMTVLSLTPVLLEGGRNGLVTANHILIKRLFVKVNLILFETTGFGNKEHISINMCSYSCPS